jgi:hypothetical protein
MYIYYFIGCILGSITSCYWWIIYKVIDIMIELKIFILYYRRLPNAEHSCAGHEVSLFFTMRSFYMSVYDVSQLFIFVWILLFYWKNRPLPSFKWTKTSNSTHGYIRATVDFSVGPKPNSVYYYHARTMNNKRFANKSVQKIFFFKFI